MHKHRKNKNKTKPIPIPEQEIFAEDLDKASINDDVKSITQELSKIRENEPKESDYSDRQEDPQIAINKKIKQFIEISKYFACPLKNTASYMCEHELVTYPRKFEFEYQRGAVTIKHLKFSSKVLEPVYVHLYKLIPDVEHIKFINLSLSRSKRIPPGLSFNIGFLYDDACEKSISSAKAIFVAARKTHTPCYQICEIDLIMSPKNLTQMNQKL